MKLFKTIRAEAHCDIPCGIYDPTPAKIAAKTVARMVDQIEEISTPADINDTKAHAVYIQTLTRRIKTKEDHAELCKHELQILWSDFFKPEHLEKYPNLHNIFWKALKLASKIKQDSHKEDAISLCETVDEIAQMFYEAKNAPEKFEAYKKITDTLY